MINTSTILTSIKSLIGIEYFCNDEVKRYGAATNLVNYIHPLITPQSVSALSEITNPQYKGDWKAGTYVLSDIVKYNNIYYIATGTTTAVPPATGWAKTDIYLTAITKEFDTKVKNIATDIYTKIKETGQTEEVFLNGPVFQRGSFSLTSDTQIIRLKPRTGKLTLNTITVRSKTTANVTVKIYDLETFASVHEATEIVNTSKAFVIDHSSDYGFLIRITTDSDLFRWEYHTVTDSLNIETRTDFDTTDVEQFKDDYFTGLTEFNCEIDAKVYCDITEWFTDNIDILIPYVLRKLAHSYLKTIYYNGAARSNKYEANEKVKNADMDIYGDKMNVGSLIQEIRDMEKTIISKYGYSSPCFKKRKGRITHGYI